uniref:AAA+ ATPase domain-containing protein n=1 Tax=Trichogramma kaykai TaxID=54128 RepID=A0ABD2W5X1_9HYME
MSLPWIHPWTSMLCGPTGCGKTFFVKKFLKNIDPMSDTRFARVILYYSEWQPTYRELEVDNIEFHEGLPQNSDYAGDPRPKLIIIDNLMRQSNGVICDLFTKNSHHNNLSVIYITQNLFQQGRGQRDVSLNSHYIVIFRNVRDRGQIQHLTRQIYPEDTRFLQEAYWDATSRPYGYILLDLKQATPDNCRFRTCIFPDDTFQYVYTPSKKAATRHIHFQFYLCDGTVESTTVWSKERRNTNGSVSSQRRGAQGAAQKSQSNTRKKYL